MRWCLAVLLALSAVPARAEEATQLDRIAAYCVAVLDTQRAAAQREPRKNCLSSDDRATCELIATAARQRDEDTRYRRERFFSYLLRRAPLVNLEFTKALKDRGIADATACQSWRDQSWPERSKGCESVCRGPYTIECQRCYEGGESAVCQSVRRCDDPSLLPF